MKKLLFMFSGLLMAGSVSAQLTLYNTKVATIHHGQPKTLIEIAEGQGVCITEFDRDGRIVSEKRDKYDYTFRYQWTETQLILTLCNDEGQVLNTVPLDYVEEPGRLQISSPKMGTIEFLFNDNGTVHQINTAKNGQEGILVAKYESDDPLLCTGYEMTAGGKVVGEATNEYTEEDEQGNPVECIQRMNGTSYAVHRKITYYE